MDSLRANQSLIRNWKSVRLRATPLEKFCPTENALAGIPVRGCQSLTIDPIDIFSWVGEQIGNRHHHKCDYCLPQQCASIVPEPVKEPNDENRQGDVKQR